jgi:uncharacterized protein
MDSIVINNEFKIDGMTCTNCSMKIENTLKKSEGVLEVNVSYSKSIAYVTYDAQKTDIDYLQNEIEKLGYKVTSEHSSIPISNDKGNSEKPNKTKKITVAGIIIIAVALYFIIRNTGGFNFLPEVNQTMGYSILFVIGLLTSLHCIAMCGGINLSQCVSKNADPAQPFKKKLKPSILYNTGRVISYTIIGGIVGALGSVLSFSGTAKGIVAIIAGVFMLIMGLNMMNVFPWIKKIVPRLPKRFGNKVQGAKKGRGPLIVGLLNGFMPCGPLQTMQLYALGTGSFFAGALSMFLFSLGTVPLMFAFGAISSILSSKFTKKLMWVSAALVMVLGVIMVGRGFSQSGISVAFANDDISSIARVEENVQLVSTEMEPNVYEPIAVQVGVPVRWTINVEEGDLNGCNNPVTIPKYGVELEMELGENIIEFTPTTEGNIVYTCWMGMISGNIMAVPDISEVSVEEIEREAYEEKQIYLRQDYVDSSSNSANSYGEGLESAKVPVDYIAIANITDGIQTVSIDVNESGFFPALIIMQKDVETKWVINGEKLDSCNNSLIFPEYEAKLDLVSGENVIEFTPTADFSFSCWMGMINGYVRVVDDIDNIDLEEIKSETSEFVAASEGDCCG